MKLLLIIVTMAIFSIKSFAGEYYEDFKNHPDFKNRLETLLGDDTPIGKPRIEETSTFGDGYDLWKKYLYVQKIKSDSLKKTLVLKVETQGVVLDCALGSDDPDMGDLIKKHCGWFDKFVELTYSVSVKEVK